MVEHKRISLVKPTLNTPYHIDFDWWKQNDQEWRVHLRSCLPPEYQQAFADADTEEVDWVDPETAEVQKVDGLQHVLINYAAETPDFITSHTIIQTITSEVTLYVRFRLSMDSSPFWVPTLRRVYCIPCHWGIEASPRAQHHGRWAIKRLSMAPCRW